MAIRDAELTLPHSCDLESAIVLRITKQLLSNAVNSVAGRSFLSFITILYRHRLLSDRTVAHMQLDLLRSHARARQRKSSPQPKHRQLHLGCGSRRISGWLNVDLADADECVDLACGSLPWSDSSFTAIVSQHVIEHLELTGELQPLLKEIHRVLHDDGQLWLSCPDLEKACRSYVDCKGADLLSDREARKAPGVSLGMEGVPTQHFINLLFDQSGEHKNLFDEELLAWALHKAGFLHCKRVLESDLLTRFPDFPSRGDDRQSIYIMATKRREDAAPIA